VVKAIIRLTIILSSLLTSVVHADPLLESLKNNREATLSNFFSITQNAEWVATLPETTGMIITKLKNGDYMVVDGNLRYAFVASKIVNIDNGEQVVDEISANNVWLLHPEQISKLPLPLFRYGVDKPKADITIMAALEQNQSTKDTVEFIKKHESNYRIDVILMATTSRKAMDSVAHLKCAEDRKIAKQRFLDMKFPVKSDPKTHLKQLPTCSMEDVLSTLTLAKRYNVKAYPFVYNEYGGYATGLPNNIDDFIAYKPTNLAHVQGLDWSNKK